MITIKTKRWNDPVEKNDGFRLLVTRYRPRGVRKKDETWASWWPELGPSRELHAAAYGKHGPPIAWSEYGKRYLYEMRSQHELIRLASSSYLTLTLLCSSACIDSNRCHRTLLKALIEQEAAA